MSSERSDTQNAVLELLEPGGSMRAGAVVEALKGKHDEQTVKMALTNLLYDGGLKEHPHFDGAYILPDDE